MSNRTVRAGSVVARALILAGLVALPAFLGACSESPTDIRDQAVPTGPIGDKATGDASGLRVDVDRDGALCLEPLTSGGTGVRSKAFLAAAETPLSDPAWTVHVDFEEPSLGGAVRLPIDPYVDPATGFVFTALDGGTLGLVKNRSTSACVDPPTDDQKLGTGNDDSIGFGTWPIRVDFPFDLPAETVLAFEVQALAGGRARLRTYDSGGNPVADWVNVVEPPVGTCGYPGSPRGRLEVRAVTPGPVRSAVVDFPHDPYVFVLDDLRLAYPPFYGLDVHPGSCPNPVNPGAKGVLPVAVLGSELADVADVDPATVRLEGAAPLRWSIRDVATHVADGPCPCGEEGGDGYEDLVLKFANRDLATVYEEHQRGETFTLTLVGETTDGRSFRIEDCVVRVGRRTAAETDRGR